MDKNRVHAIIANAVESGGSFSPIDRVKFVQFAKMHGIEYSVIEEVIDITQTISLIHLREDRLDASDLPREEEKAMCAELQKSIDENLKALKSIRNSFLVRDRLRMWFLLPNENWLQEILKNKNNI